jgi:hypothetical protein
VVCTREATYIQSDLGQDDFRSPSTDARDRAEQHNGVRPRQCGHFLRLFLLRCGIRVVLLKRPGLGHLFRWVHVCCDFLTHACDSCIQLIKM